MNATAAPEHPLMGTYPTPPVTFVRGEGTRLWDRDGTEYLDFLCGLAVTGLGHAHPVVADAIAEQARTLLHVSNLYGNEIGPDVARTLDRLHGGGGRVFFTNSGAESNECALKLARKWGGRGRHVVVSALGSFHGRTLATLHATGQPAKHEAFQPLPEGFRHVAWDDIDALKQALDPTVAAVLLEVVQGEGGVNPGRTDYLQQVQQLCRDRGILFMIDEIQTGLGRTGAWFAYQHHDLSPDVVTMAKALGNGMPIGACWARTEVADVFEVGDHGTTYGGQPLAASAAQATLSVMETEDVCARARTQGAALTAALEARPEVAEVRGLGLLLAAELHPGIDARAVAAEALRQGLVVNGVTPSALRFAPPLLVSDDEIAEGVGRLGVALAAITSETSPS